ncbi:MAG: thioredoxin domain-containing protein [Chlamydiia bacterium]|nr:thioredoxin domain-containing protein [Chlamydiia bacterium]
MAKMRINKLFFGILPAFALLVSKSILFAEIGEGAVPSSFEKLGSTYTVSYGDQSAPIHMTEYFSFSCPKCLEFIRRDFPTIQSKYIDTGKVFWTFHPDPADILTLQTMVCFELLDNLEKQSLIEKLAGGIRVRSFKKACFMMQEEMNALGKPIPTLHDLSFLEKTEAFNRAYAYLKQTNVPSELPTIEANGILYQEFPSREWIDRTLIDLQTDATKRRSE